MAFRTLYNHLNLVEESTKNRLSSIQWSYVTPSEVYPSRMKVNVVQLLQLDEVNFSTTKYVMVMETVSEPTVLDETSKKDMLS